MTFYNKGYYNINWNNIVGVRRIAQLARNTRYVRRKLHQMGLIVYGNENSPVIPVLVYLFSKIG